MTESFNERITLHNADCLEVLRALPENSIDSIVTDPPAGIGFMGRKWDGDKGGRDQWIAWMAQVAAECLRVIKPGGHALVWAIPRTSHWTATAWENAGWDVRDRLAHIFGSGFPKSHNLQGEWEGWGTALKPAMEDWWLLRKPLDGTVAKNVLSHGTGAMNIDGCRVPSGEDHAAKCASVVGLSSNRNGSAYGEWKGERTDSHNIAGRWPANLIHDGSDEVLVGFPETTSGTKSPHHRRTTSKTKNAFGQREAPPENFPGDSGSAARFFYCAKASKADRGDANTHPTVKPVALMRYLCRLVTPPNGVCLDPFLGSGSTGKAAMLEGFRFVGIEREAEYFAIAEARIRHAAKERERQETEPVLL